MLKRSNEKMLFGFPYVNGVASIARKMIKDFRAESHRQSVLKRKKSMLFPGRIPGNINFGVN